ncbi:hypothetical protein CEXT_4771 [Caerostris extrusa]|uniref:Uncharacterized protein n=1 Tax=Caerostris extrusa TaxID=172846 RepID=A0AAV4N1G2_CAEEX|nr:hypothetical protein CEXT_4771 [Caerostris extrusa]
MALVRHGGWAEVFCRAGLGLLFRDTDHLSVCLRAGRIFILLHYPRPAAFRENAMGLISLFASQTIKMAQLQGRLMELENQNSREKTLFACSYGRKLTELEKNFNDRLILVKTKPPKRNTYK